MTIIPTNCGDLVGEVIAALGSGPSAPVVSNLGVAVSLTGMPDRHCCSSEVTEEAIERMAYSATDPTGAEALRRLVDDSPVGEDHILDLLRRFPSARLALDALSRSLAELKPRLYSIPSPPERH